MVQKRQKRVSRRPGGWTSEVKELVGLESAQGPLPSSQVPSHLCVFTFGVFNKGTHPIHEVPRSWPNHLPKFHLPSHHSGRRSPGMNSGVTASWYHFTSWIWKVQCHFQVTWLKHASVIPTRVCLSQKLSSPHHHPASTRIKPKSAFAYERYLSIHVFGFCLFISLCSVVLQSRHQMS